MNFRKILLLSRPRFWIYILGPFIIGITPIHDPKNFPKIIIVYGFFYFLFPANLLIYGINDYFDRQIDLKNPKKIKQETRMKSSDMKTYQIFIALSVLLSLPLLVINKAITISMLIFIFFAIFYSSPPLRFKTKIILDSLSNVFYIFPGIIGFLLATDNFPSYDIIIAGWLWSIAMHLFSAIVDIDSDRKANIRTTAIFLGYRKSLLLTSILWLFSVLFILHYSIFFIFGFIYAILPLYILIKRADIRRIYWMYPRLNAILGFFLFWIAFYG